MWKTFVVVILVFIVTASAGPINSCGFRENTAEKQSRLNILNGFFGKLLKTEFNNSIYLVSICHPIPQTYNDQRTLVGAIKYTQDGHLIDLGHIDQTDIVFNDNNIELTYGRHNEERNPGDKCKGIALRTHLTFICDQFATKEVLTLVDENLNQPEICDVWFEIKTSEICALKPVNNDIQIKEQRDIESNENNSNKFPFGYKSFNNTNNEFSVNKQILNTENNPQIIYPSEKLVNNIRMKYDENAIFEKEKENINDENNFKEESFSSNDNNYFKKKNSEYDNNKENLKNHKVEFEKSSKNENYSIENKFMKNENKNTDSHSKIFENYSSNKENLFENNNNKLNSKILENNSIKNRNVNLQYKNVEVETFDGKYKNSDQNTFIGHENNDNSIVNSKMPSNYVKNNSMGYQMFSNQGNEKKNSNESVLENKLTNNSDSNKKSLESGKIKSKTSAQEEEHCNKNMGKEGNPTNEEKINNNNSNLDTTTSQSTNNGWNNSAKDNTINIRVKDNNSNRNKSQNMNSEGESSKSNIVNYDKGKNAIHNKNESINSLSNTTDHGDVQFENKNKSSRKNANDENKINTNETITNNNKSSTDNSDNTTPIVNTYSSTETTTGDGSTSNNNNSNGQNTKDKPESNITYVNPTNNAKQNSQSDISKSNQNAVEDSNTSNYLRNNSENNLNTIVNISQPIDSNSIFFSKLFPNGIHLSLIIGMLGLLLCIYLLVGTVVNRYYYKITGTDQIPHKEAFKTVFTHIKVSMKKICCCCFSEDDSEELDSTNEKTPLLHSKHVHTPTVEDETFQKKEKTKNNSDGIINNKGENSDNDSINEQTNKIDYGSMLSENRSPTFDKKSLKEKHDSISKNEPSSYDDKKKLIKIEHNLLSKSPKDISINVEEIEAQKTSSTDDNNGLKKVALLATEPYNKMESTDKLQDSKLKEYSYNQNENSKEKVINKTNEPLNGSESNGGVQKIMETINENDLFSFDNTFYDKTKDISEKMLTSIGQKSSNSAIIMTPTSDIKNKINESKLKFLGHDVPKNEGKENSGQIAEDDEDVEVIEEIVYIDGDDDEDTEEIIEETVTTTIEDSQSDSNESPEHSNGDKKPHTTVTTVRKTSVRKLSSPNEVNIVEETVVISSGNTPENEKKRSGFQLGVDKSGVNVSVGEKKIDIDKSGVNFDKRSNKDETSEAITVKLNRSELKLDRHRSMEEQELQSDESSSPKKSKLNFKMFKRSKSQSLSNPDIREGDNESDSTWGNADIRKPSRSSAGLLKFGRSWSKPSKSLETLDDNEFTSVTDFNSMSDFIDNERQAINKSNIGTIEFKSDITPISVPATENNSNQNESSKNPIQKKKTPKSKRGKKK